MRRCPAEYSSGSASFPAGRDGLGAAAGVSSEIKLGSLSSEISKGKGLKLLSGLLHGMFPLTVIRPALSMRKDLQELVQLLSAGGAGDSTDRVCEKDIPSGQRLEGQEGTRLALNFSLTCLP